MTGPRTIPRNAARRIAALRERMTVCKVYTLENQFHGAVVDPVHAWAALERSRSARLYLATGGNAYIIHVHDNRWYTLTEG